MSLSLKKLIRSGWQITGTTAWSRWKCRGTSPCRGGIIDIYLPGDFEQEADQIGLAIRVDFFGDQIESIKKFDLDSLGSGEVMQAIRIMDLKGQLPETSGSTHLFSYFDPNTVVVLWAPLEIAEQAKSYIDRLPELKGKHLSAGGVLLEEADPAISLASN